MVRTEFILIGFSYYKYVYILMVVSKNAGIFYHGADFLLLIETNVVARDRQ